MEHHPHESPQSTYDSPTPAQDTPENAVDRQIPRVRYVFVLPIIAAFAASAVLMVLGFYDTFHAIFLAFTNPHGPILETLRLHFVEAIDVFLLATILYVISGGFYQLFLGRKMNIPGWLRVDSVHDLEVLLIGVVITLLGVTGLAAVMSWDGQTDLLPYGATIALIIAALAFYVGRAPHS
jgi:uncharacterized membrane protein YqhA